MLQDLDIYPVCEPHVVLDHDGASTAIGRTQTARIPRKMFFDSINVTSFSVFHTEVNSEFWSQNGNIQSIELDVYAEKQSVSIKH